MDSTSGRSNLALNNFSQDSSFSNRILIYGSLRSIVHFIKYTNKNFKTRSEESCGFYKSSNGESYQNELTGVRNSFLTPVFEALKVQDQGLHRYPITAFMKTSALIRKNETTSKIQIPYIFKVALILFLNHLAINQNLRFYY